ncbi:MAG: MlaD family protein [Candidatus Aminicenantales bacterium]
MVTKEQKIRLGIFLAVSLVLMIILLGLFLLPTLKEEGETYFINFKGISVNGLYNGSPVKYQGVEIGSVSQITVNPKDLNSILVYIKVKRLFPVKKDMTATLIYTGITGQKFVELSGGKNDSENLSPQGEIRTGRGLGEKAEDIVSNIDSAVQSINRLLDPKNQQRISLFLENAEKTSEVISSVLGKKRENLENSITYIEKASLEFGEVTEKLRQVMENLRQLTGKLEAGSGEALNSLTKRFSDEEMGEVIKNLDAFIEIASSSLKKMENVLLLQQEQLKNTLENLAVAIDNLSKFSRELMEDPTLFIRSRKEKKK